MPHIISRSFIYPLLPMVWLFQLAQATVTKIPQTRWLTNNRNLFLIALEAGSLRLGCQRGRVLLRALFWVVDSQLLIVSRWQWAERGNKLSCVSCKYVNAIHEGTTLMISSNPHPLPNASPSNTIRLERVGFQHMDFGGNTFIQSIALVFDQSL